MISTDPGPVTRLVPGWCPLPVDLTLLRTYVDLLDIPVSQFTYGDGSFRFSIMQQAIVHYRAYGGPESTAMRDVVTSLLWLRRIAQRSPAELRCLLSHPCNGALSDELRQCSPAAWAVLFAEAG